MDLGKWSLSGHELVDRLNNLKPMGCDEKGEAVMDFETAYWHRSLPAPAFLILLKRVATPLVASEDKTPSRSGRCVPCLPMCQIAGRVMAALVLMMRAPVAPSFFLAAEASYG
ncbi:hypothetical protein [Ruegeria sp. ANG-R]|uniref:hypothetical protein n=1 Tax=Ruegeria sp. ANG-R TaxID=1577903 RepID=UPI001269C15D|nr:hypothetical protein [Ruegeria sp. ANG-R]